jgi:hypothetical protein
MSALGELLTLKEAYRVCGQRDHVLRLRIERGLLPAVWDDTVYPPRYRVRRADLRGIGPAWRLWTDRDDDQLLALVGRIPVEAIARKLKRSVCAVRHRMKRLGVNERMGDGDFLTANQASLVFGVTREGVLDWIRRGELCTRAYRPVHGAVRCHLIAQEEIERFIRTRVLGPPGKKPHWQWQRMPAGYFRNYAERLARRESRDDGK